MNQVFRGDGNLRVNTLAEYLHTMGYEADIRLVRAGEPRRATIEQRAVRPVAHDWRLRAPQATSSGVFLAGEEGQPHLVRWTSASIGDTDSIRLEAELHPMDSQVPSPAGSEAGSAGRP